MTIPGVSKQDLKDESKLSELLETWFQQVEILTQESMKWPLLYEHGQVTTRCKPKKKNEEHAYFQRSSTHTSVTYDQLRSMLYLDHSLNELKYIKALVEVDLVASLGQEANIVRLGFKTPPLSKNREFVEVVATKEKGRSFMVVSKPVYDHPVKQGYVRGAYQAWEFVSEKENGAVEWICIQYSSAGGSIPRFLSDYVAGKDFHHDVQSLLKHINDNKSV